ncbi:murein biosynthesis integral membrane protein MurJ [Sporosarcina sp. E16_3]|uniref:murein biosynthesis integral membrane protein MurJ n=1 Tax=Sporosarcina sp. E16_3 TaxID=2789293 RepID=UPI001A9227A2|nr:murein biosynthesis integral membrane protein MurJ [Sporosarcina sp. E16_3]MBO0602825.1 murein biosynthesis integral membrane protein MurJ [Sporosarcina sp. E16_3]
MNKMMKIIGAVAVINIVARLFGFAREMAIGNQYGTSSTADAIITAYTIPNFIYLVVGGALTTAFISVYHSTRTDKALFVRKSFTTVLVAAVAITAVLMIFTDPLLHLFFKDLTAEEFAMTRTLYLWMMPSSIILVLSTWMSGVLNVNGKFNLSSLAVLLYNASFVGIAVVLTSYFGPESYGIGAMVGALVMGAFLYVGLRKSKLYSLKPSFAMSVDTKRLWVIALPILFGGASLQFYFVIHRIVADGLGEGTISAVNFASKLTGFPQAIMMTAVTTVIYPLLSKKQGEGDMETIRALYKKGMLYLVALLVPATVIAYFFAEPLVRLVFEHGEFSEKSVLLTVPIFRVFTLSMFFLAANTYITRFYYAKANSLVPVIFSLISVFGINIAVIYLMIDSYGASAIAYGTVISAAVNFVMLAIYARVKWKL